MAVTRSWTARGSAPRVVQVEPCVRMRSELGWLVCASLFVAAGLAMVYAAKLQSFADAGRLVNLNRVGSAEELMPLLESFTDRTERESVAQQTFEFLVSHRPLRNVGAVAGLRKRGGRGALLPLGKLKPLMAVRSPAEFRSDFVRWSLVYFAGFYAVALVWSVSRFRGDRAFLPALHLLTGIGLALMASMRDPLRDTLEFHKFALGVFLGCLLLALPALKIFDYRRLSDWCYTPLFGALALFGLLLAFGKGPTGNDAKVNLGPFQPVEAIKILLVLFLAGYFTRNWERLRDLREKHVLPGFFPRAGLPRLQHMIPVACAVAVALVFFFVLKDLGPALVTFFVFLAMFAVARGRPGLAMAGLLVLVGSVAIGYRAGQPHTVVERINMWLGPWDNDVHGGDQLANGLWAFSTGGPFGSGPGWGDPAMIPAGIRISSAGHWRRMGLRGRGDGVSAVGLSGIARAAGGGTLGHAFRLFPGGGAGQPDCVRDDADQLGRAGRAAAFGRGVAIPQLGQYGHAGQFPGLCADSIGVGGPARIGGGAGGPVASLKTVLACAGLVLVAMAARYQVFQDRQYLARDALAFEQDGVKRPQHNPRMNSLAREVPRGGIYDRNGIPLATSNWHELERHRVEYANLGISIEQAASRFDNRHYPFGAATEHLLGDLRTGENFHASNASLVEHDANTKLQGYQYAELASLVRYRHQPENPAIAKLLARDRDVRLTIDIRLQLRAKEILERHLQETRNRNGAVVVLDSASGDLLAMVSVPAPDPPGTRTAMPSPDELLDRARYGQYPPGSTFKLVTAIAALRGNPELKHRTFLCHTLPDGRAGTTIAGWNRAIKDDIGDRAHGTLDMERAIAVSCNAYFAQLGVHDVGSKALADTAAQFGISTGDPAELRKALPFAAYGQGPVLISPFKMARVAAAIANGGQMPEGRWIGDASNPRNDPPLEVLPASQAEFLAGAMRRVVTEGTARHVMAGEQVGMAGKTGTAQLDEGMPHAWFTGFAPIAGGRRLAFAVLVEHGGYGGRVAAPVAREVMEAAKQLGLMGPGQSGMAPATQEAVSKTAQHGQAVLPEAKR